MVEQKLNLDIAGAVSELETLLKKVLPKNIMYQLLLSRGLEFEGYRDYTQNDDASDIDWKASVRGKKPLVRTYVEERDLKFIIVVDVGDNMVFGSTEKLKCEYAAELSAALAHLILITGDRVGFVLFNEDIVRNKRPEMGNRQFEIFVDYLSDPLVYGGPSDLKKVLESLTGTLDRDTSMVFLVSDFIKVDETYRKALETFANLFETTAIVVRDPLDNRLPEMGGEVVIENPETGQKLLVNPKVAKKIYEKNAREQLQRTEEMLRNANIDFLELLTDKSFPEEFAAFLKERVKERRIVNKNVY